MFLKSSITVELEDNTLDEETSTFLEKPRNSPPLFPKLLGFSLSATYFEHRPKVFSCM